MILYLLAGLLSQIHPANAASTSISIGVSANPVLLGQPVAITAAVLPTNAAGSVTFYTGVSVLGIAPVSSGQATFSSALLPAGANALTARFDANPSFATSLSPPLILTVAVAPGTGFPGGAIYPVGLTPVWVVTADLNNDGIADLVTANTGDGTVSVFLGNGDGTFQPVFPDLPTGTNPASIAVGDFNGDGIEDLAVANSGDPSVTILLGNGDGTFQALASMFFGSDPVSVVEADFNGDGIADLAVADQDNDTATILLGLGDGTFVPGIAIPAGVGATQIAVADFNGDGKPDLAIAGSSPDGVAEFLGNGDGTFTLQTIWNAGTGPSSIAAGDFNGDGKIDLAVGDIGDDVSFSGGGIEILLGNGNGTFQTPIAAASGPNVSAIATADLDGDGKLDLGVLTLGGGFSTYLGNGDGTVQAPQSYPAGDSPDALAIGSFDGTGLTEVAVVNRNENLMDVLTGSPGACSYTLSPASLIYDATGVTAAVSLTASATGCAWFATSDAWIVPQSSAGLGGGSFSFQLLPNNTGFDRTGSLVVGGQTVAITQRFTTMQFSDVPVSSYQFDAVNLLKQQGVTEGCGTDLFCPTEQVTRAQMAVFIVRAVMGGDNFAYPAQPIFSDVQPSTFGFQWIQKLSELGITSGCAVDLYCPDNPVTRAQMAVFIIRGRFGSTAIFSYPLTPYFTDVPSGLFGFEWIQRMRLDGITNGCALTEYCPNNSVVRGDMAIFIMKGLFNDLYPPGTPTLISVSPSVLVRGQTTTFTFTGSGTNFVQGQTTVSTVPNVAVTNVEVLSPTLLIVNLNAAQSAPVQPVGLVAITGSEQDVLPNGVTIQ
jgi:hypothetical protein